jgi:hypothetical protein
VLKPSRQERLGTLLAINFAYGESGQWELMETQVGRAETATVAHYCALVTAYGNAAQWQQAEAVPAVSRGSIAAP